MEIINWELLEQFYEQTAKDNETAQRFGDRIVKAREKVTTASIRHESLLRREAIERVNLSEELAEARKEVAVAAEELRMVQEDSERIRQMIHEANAADPSRISLLDLAKNWLSEYKPRVEAEQLDPIKQRIANARAENLIGIAEFFELRREYTAYYGDIHDNLRGVRNENGHTIFTPGMQWDAGRELQLITEQELFDAQHAKLPNDIKRKGGRD